MGPGESGVLGFGTFEVALDGTMVRMVGLRISKDNTEYMTFQWGGSPQGPATKES